jgi:hypothetical protein
MKKPVLKRESELVEQTIRVNPFLTSELSNVEDNILQAIANE